MPTARKSALVPHSCETLFALVDDVERYPEFLPWCSGVKVFARDEAFTHARIEVDYHGLKSHVTTRNAKEPPRRMTLELEEGPFERFHGEWTFKALGAQGCRVEFALEYEAAGGAIATLLERVFGLIASTMVDRFVVRAGEVAGDAS
jgi:ribosome-associated toxin RatA of RatAB toxin-antitoxin module